MDENKNKTGTLWTRTRTRRAHFGREQEQDGHTFEENKNKTDTLWRRRKNKQTHF